MDTIDSEKMIDILLIIFIKYMMRSAVNFYL